MLNVQLGNLLQWVLCLVQVHLLRLLKDSHVAECNVILQSAVQVRWCRAASLANNHGPALLAHICQQAVLFVACPFPCS